MRKTDETYVFIIDWIERCERRPAKSGTLLDAEARCRVQPRKASNLKNLHETTEAQLEGPFNKQLGRRLCTLKCFIDEGRCGSKRHCREAKEAVTEATQILRDFYNQMGPSLVQLRRGFWQETDR